MNLTRLRCRHGGMPIAYARARGHLLGLLAGLVVFSGSSADQSGTAAVLTANSTTAVNAIQQEESRMWMTIANQRFAISLADTEAARAFAALLPLILDMPDLNSNEKHAPLPTALPTSPVRPGTLRSGDLMLYGAQTLVVFYQTFDSVYAYTPLGQVDDPAELARALGSGTARIHFSRD